MPGGESESLSRVNKSALTIQLTLRSDRNALTYRIVRSDSKILLFEEYTNVAAFQAYVLLSLLRPLPLHMDHFPLIPLSFQIRVELIICDNDVT